MKKARCFVILWLCINQLIFGGDAGRTFVYESVPGDPVAMQLYRLPNGFSLYMSVNKDQPRIQTYFAVRTGSRNDPADATGLAHYLEHQLFKGTTTVGSLNYTAEWPLLEQIEALYEMHRNAPDTLKKQRIYHLIDSLSGVAAKYSVANEYDRMITRLGAKGTNAYTSYDETVYTNDIPSNQLENFLKLEADRFRNPVLRRFHTELEAVYEEKNRGLDSDINQAFELLMEKLLPGHPYGTQTTIGTVEHLKNPSIKAINAYLKRYYVPANMALIMSGDFNPDDAAALTLRYFGDWSAKGEDAPVFTTAIARGAPEEVSISGPESPFVLMGFALQGANTRDADMLQLVSKMLYNEKAGLFDTGINLPQKTGLLTSETELLADYSLLLLQGKPLSGQDPALIPAMAIEQLEKIKNGDFPDWLMQASVNAIKLEKMRQYESNLGRVRSMLGTFLYRSPRLAEVSLVERLGKITRPMLMEFVKQMLSTRFVTVIKKNGDRPPSGKISKPSITPVVTNSSEQSKAASAFQPEEVPAISPVFLDYGKQIKKGTVNQVPCYYVHNPRNSLFSLTILLKKGKAHDKRLEPALLYQTFAGTNNMDAETLGREFFTLGCSYDFVVDENETRLVLSGLSENFEKALMLMEACFKDVKNDKEALGKYIGQEMQQREEMQENKNVLLQQAMSAYGKFGPLSPFRNTLTTDEVNSLTSQELSDEVKNILSYAHELWYFGPASAELAMEGLQKHHQVPKTLRPATEHPFKPRNISEGSVLYLDYPMKQTEALIIRSGYAFDTSKIAISRIHSAYFGSGLNSIVGQELREARALAYSVFSQLAPGRYSRMPLMGVSYIGTQADKLSEALKGFHGLLDTMPLQGAMFTEACKSVRQKIASERVLPRELLDNFYQARQYGLHHDIRKDVYELSAKITLSDLAEYHRKSISGKQGIILLIGNKQQILSAGLSVYGPLQELTRREIFGFD
jgi:predicted Zn-dependent peptidase